MLVARLDDEDIYNSLSIYLITFRRYSSESTSKPSLVNN